MIIPPLGRENLRHAKVVLECGFNFLFGAFAL